MRVASATFAAVSLTCLTCWPGPGGEARAQRGVDIPQYERVEQAGYLGYLRTLAKRTSPTGPAAQAVLDVLVPKLARLNAFVLPPLVLLSALADGEVTPDMRWAVAMADRAKAEHEALRQSHVDLKKALLALRDAAAAEGDTHTVGFTADLIDDDLSDQEIDEPLSILIGEILRARLPAE